MLNPIKNSGTLTADVRSADFKHRLSVYLRLVKLRLVLLVLVSCATGFALANRGPVDWSKFLPVVMGAALMAAGVLALNQWMEREYDSRMVRTSSRPLPMGDLNKTEAFGFGFLLILAGSFVLLLSAQIMSLKLGLLTVILYLAFYTPMKRWTSLCVYVGAVAGALPPLMGWAAVRPEFSAGAWTIFAILFFWQLLHFTAIAWVYREDYRRAGFALSEIRDVSGVRTSRKALVWGIFLVAVSLIPTLIALSGWVYFAAALVLGGWVLSLNLNFMKRLECKSAKKLMLSTILYLFLLLGFMVFNKI